MALPPFLPEDVYADYNVPFNPTSGAKQPDKQQIRALLRFVLDQISALEGTTGIDPSVLINLRRDLDATTALSRETVSDLGLADLRIDGGDTLAFSEIAVGNPADAPSLIAPAATGSTWIDAGTTFSDASLVSVAVNINAVGSGQGAIVLVAPQDGGGYQIKRKIDVTITGAGAQALRVGRDLPEVVLRAGWMLGWYAPAGGAQIGYGGGGVSFQISGAPVVGAAVSLIGGNASLGLSVTYRGLPDRIVGYAPNAGEAAADGTLWVSTDAAVRFEDGYLRSVTLWVMSEGSGSTKNLGVICVLSPSGSGWRIEAALAATGLRAGLNSLVLGRDFPPVRLRAGWAMGFYSPAGGARIAFTYSGNTANAAAIGAVAGQFVTLSPVPGACISLSSAQIQLRTPLSERIDRLSGSVSTLVAVDASQPAYDRVTDCAITVSGLTLTARGTFSRAGKSIAFTSSVTLDPAPQNSFDIVRAIEPMTVQTYAFAPPANRMPQANLSLVTVRDANTNALLVEGVDYLVGYEHGVVGALGGSTRSMRIVAAFKQRRYDGAFIDPETLTLSVVKGTGRIRDAQEFVPPAPAATGARSPIRLCNVRLAQGIEIIPTWDVDPDLGVRRPLAGQVARDMRHAARALVSTRSRAASGQAIVVASAGDSIVAQQIGSPSFTRTPPNGVYRDRSVDEYLSQPGALGSDVLSTISLYDTGDGAGQAHTRLSVAWSVVQALQGYGSAVSYLNFCQGGTTSSQFLADTTWRDGVLNSGANLLIWHFGQNEEGDPDIEYRTKDMLSRAYARGMDVIIFTNPRKNAQFGGSTRDGYLITCAALRRAAEWVDPATGRTAAFVDASVLYDDAQLGALGISRNDHSAANLFNHPGPFEIQTEGALAARIVTDGIVSVVGVRAAADVLLGLLTRVGDRLGFKTQSPQTDFDMRGRTSAGLVAPVTADLAGNPVHTLLQDPTSIAALRAVRPGVATMDVRMLGAAGSTSDPPRADLTAADAGVALLTLMLDGSRRVGLGRIPNSDLDLAGRAVMSVAAPLAGDLAGNPILTLIQDALSNAGLRIVKQGHGSFDARLLGGLGSTSDPLRVDLTDKDAGLALLTMLLGGRRQVGFGRIPQADFDVYGRGVFSDTLTVNPADITGAPVFTLVSDGQSNAHLRLLKNGVGKGDLIFQGTAADKSLNRVDFRDVDNDKYPLTVMLNGSGRVGIGGVVPQERLHVDGAFRLSDAATGGGLTMLYPPGLSGSRSLELLFRNNIPGLNTLALQNMHAEGFSAIVFRDNSDVEHGAVGYGNSGVGYPFTNRTYWEISHYTGQSHTTPPPDGVIVSTGYMDGKYGLFPRAFIGKDGFFNLTNIHFATNDFRFDQINSRFGLRVQNPVAEFQVNGAGVFANFEAVYAPDVTAGYQVNIVNTGGAVMRLIKANVVKADVQINGAAGGADRRLSIRDTDNGGGEPLSVMLNGSGRVGINQVAPQVTLDVGGPIRAGPYTVGTVPAGVVGAQIYVSNARKPGEAAGAGTGVVAVYSNGAWLRTSDYSQIAA